MRYQPTCPWTESVTSARTASAARATTLRATVSVAAAEVHRAIDARRVGTKDALDQAHVLEEGAPVARLHETYRGDGVGDRDLVGGAAPVPVSYTHLRAHETRH